MGGGLCARWLTARRPKRGVADRLSVLNPIFPEIAHQVAEPRESPRTICWAALRRYRDEAKCVCMSERDERGLEVSIWY
jgi:hypothetical protein